MGRDRILQAGAFFPNRKQRSRMADVPRIHNVNFFATVKNTGLKKGAGPKLGAGDFGLREIQIIQFSLISV